MKQTIRDLVALAGAGLVAFGAWRVYPPAGFIVGGVLLVAGAWLHQLGDSAGDQ